MRDLNKSLAEELVPLKSTVPLALLCPFCLVFISASASALEIWPVSYLY